MFAYAVRFPMQTAKLFQYSLLRKPLLSYCAHSLPWQDTAVAARPSLSAKYSGWDASHGTLVASLREHGPVDGILGVCCAPA